jgi:hypothetical protein
MGFVPTGHRPIKSRHFYQAGDNILCVCAQHAQLDVHSFSFTEICEQQYVRPISFFCIENGKIIRQTFFHSLKHLLSACLILCKKFVVKLTVFCADDCVEVLQYNSQFFFRQIQPGTFISTIIEEVIYDSYSVRCNLFSFL